MSGQAAFQVKFEQFHDSLIPVVTPFGLMRMVPPWQKGDAVDAARVAECVQHFITAMDALRLDQRAVDEVQPLVADLAAALSRVAAPCPGGRAALERWLVALNGMRAAEEIDDAQARQLAFDLDAAYAEFHRGLKDAS